ncbi:uncharacterized protein LOC101462800 [Ceratitis capitata]|uniref:uncharacterized protein LOC101462800 n=1 Tax=Ceratitis capitata TaxID=7213 RepID=UPI00032A32B9|nr:uncharacterized protein LOC101462800 [Ceratitis capitata]
MKFLQISTLLTFALLTCVVSLTNAAVICIDESSLDKVHDGKVNERQSNEDGITLNSTDLSTAATNGTQHGQSQVTQFLQTVQDTLEKAKPWVFEMEKEAKRLEETAKRFGEGVIRGLGKFVDRLIGTANGNGSGSGSGSGAAKPNSGDEPSTTNPLETTNTDEKQSDMATSTASAVAVAEVAVEAAAAAAAADAGAVDDAENEISGQQDDSTLCPDGFVADANGICLRNHK